MVIEQIVPIFYNTFIWAPDISLGNRELGMRGCFRYKVTKYVKIGSSFGGFVRDSMESALNRLRMFSKVVRFCPGAINNVRAPLSRPFPQTQFQNYQIAKREKCLKYHTPGWSTRKLRDTNLKSPILLFELNNNKIEKLEAQTSPIIYTRFNPLLMFGRKMPLSV